MTKFLTIPIFSIISITVSILYLFSSFVANTVPLLVPLRVISGFLLIAYIVGASIRIFATQVLKCSDLPSSISIGGISCDILLSLLVNLSMSALLARTFLLNELVLVVIIVPIIVLLNSIILKQSLNVKQFEQTISLKNSFNSIIISFAILAVSSILFAFFFRSQTPFPSISGWDINSILANVNWIFSQGGSNYLLIPSYPAGGTPYPALFFFITSSYSLILGISPYQLLWYGIFPLIFCYMLSIFLISLKFSKNLWLSFTSAFIAFFISVILAEVVRNPLYLTLDMTSQLIFLLIVVFNLYFDSTKIWKNILNVFAVLWLIVFDYYVAVAVLPFLLWAIIGQKKVSFLDNGQKVFRISILAIAFLAPILIAISSYLVPAFSPLFTNSELPIATKINFFTQMYPLYFWVLFMLAFFSIMVLKGNNSKNLTYLDILLYLLLGFSVYFYPAWITFRLEFYLRIFLAVFISGIAFLLDTGPLKRELVLKVKRNISKKFTIGSFASFCLLIVTVALMYPAFANFHVDSYISQDEYNAAMWLNNNASPTAYLITDPSSGYVFRGLTLHNASSFFVLPDGRMPAISPLYPQLVNASRVFLNSESSLAWGELSKTLPSDDAYILITSRTVYWASSPVEITLTHPMAGVNFSRITDKLLMPYFEQVYNSDTVKIYRPNPSLKLERETIFSNSLDNWTWYLDGSYGPHSINVINNTLNLNAQANSSESAWIGLTTNLNCSGASLLEINSKLESSQPITSGHPYLTELLLFNSSGSVIQKITNIGLNPVFTAETFPLTALEANSISSMSIIIWTKDTHYYIWRIQNITFSNWRLIIATS